MIVYQVTNLINNKRYVCVTSRTLNHAIWSHREKSSALSRRMKLKPTAKMGKTPFQKALIRHGEHNFSYSLVESFDSKEDAYSYKERLIKKWNTTNPDFGYNCTTGGLESYSMTPESMERMSVAGTGKTQPESYVNFMKARVGEQHPCFGLKHTEEARENMRRGQLNSDYVQTEEVKRQKSEAMKKRWQEPEVIARMANRKLRDISGKNNPMYGVSRKGKDNPMYGKRAWNRGIPMTEEQNKKLQDGREKYHTKKRKELLEKYSQRTEKKCYMCKDVKPLDMFYKSKINLDGYGGYCKPCESYRKGYKKGKNYLVR
jgi:group I intron endonuclease